MVRWAYMGSPSKFRSLLQSLRGSVPRWESFLSALLCVIAFPPWDLSYLLWIAWIPFFWWVDRLPLDQPDRRKQIWIQSFWLGFFMSLGGFYWVARAIHQFGNLPWVLAGLCLLLFCCINQPQALLFGPLYDRFQNRVPRWALPFMVGALYVGLDRLIPKLFLDTLGHGFYNSPWIRQNADIGGAYLLTFFILMHNRALTSALVEWRKSKRWASTGFIYAPALAIVLLAHGYGYWRNQQLETRMQETTHRPRFAVIQANIGDFEKLASESGVRNAANGVVEKYVFQSKQAAQAEPKPDFIVWPETAYPSTFGTPGSYAEQFRDRRILLLTRKMDTPLIFGGYDTDGRWDYNSIFFLGVDGKKDIYHKHIPLPFGEYIPGFDENSIFKELFPAMGFFGRGPGAMVVEAASPRVSPVRISPIICYEALFSEYLRTSTQMGAQLILNVTNDSWFGPWGEPYLHMALSVFRSIENHIPQLRATNTGISTLVLPTGEMVDPTVVYSKATLQVEVPIIEPPTSLFALWGTWFEILCASLVGLTCLGLAGQRFLRRKK